MVYPKENKVSKKSYYYNINHRQETVNELLKNIKNEIFPYIIMKIPSVTIIVMFLLALKMSAQKVYSVEYQNQANIKVFVVDYENQADLKVYKVNYQNQADNNEGRWFFTDYSNQSDKKIYFVQYANQADLKIYFVKYENQVGWNNKSKMHLLY